MRFLPQPQWAVTWPTRPAARATVRVRAADAADAVRIAEDVDHGGGPGYLVAYDCEPSVWRLRHPFRWRSRHVQGPRFPEPTPGVPFTPVPAEPEVS